MRADVVDAMVSQHIPHDAYAEAWDVDGLAEDVKRSSISICRSPTGRRKKASPTRR